MKKILVWLGCAWAVGLAAPAFAGSWSSTQLCWGAKGSESEMFDACTNTYDAVTGSTTSTVDRLLPNPDGVSPDQHFLGQGTASATPDTWRVSASIMLTDYRRDNYVWTVNADGIQTAATTVAVSASTSDSVTISGGTGVYSLQYILSVDGVLGSSDPGLVSSSFCASLYIPGGTGAASSYCLNAGQSTPSSITLTYADLPFGGPITPTLTISAYSFVSPLTADEVEALGANTFSASAFIEFGSTVHLTSLRVTDEVGNAIPGLSIESASGYTYPLDPQNTAPVPEPASLWMLAAGLAGLIARRRLARPAA